MKLEKIKSLVEKAVNKNLSQANRERSLVYTRAVFYKLCRQHTREALAAIGKVLDKDHATVLHGIKLFDDIIVRYEKQYYNLYKKLDIEIRSLKGETDKEIDPAGYYRNKYATTLLALRKERQENRLLKKQIV